MYNCTNKSLIHINQEFIMQALGTILSDKKLKNVIGFVDVTNDDSVINNSSNPILIIGLDNARKYSDNFSILNKQISDRVFWTYGKTEKRNEYELDLNKFYDFVLKYAIKDIKYYYINILTLKYNNIKKLINILYNGIKKYIYISNNILYIYYNNYIMGISLEILKMIGISYDKVIMKIQSNPNNIVCFSDSFLDLKIKRAIKNKKYVIPYFMSIQ